MKRLKSNQHGFAHHIILPVLAVLVVAGIGTHLLGIDHAAALESTITVKSNSEECVDNKQGRKVNYNEVRIYVCNEGTNQQWAVEGSATSAGEIVNYNGYCLNVYNAGKTVGTNVDLYTCTNSAAQKWTVNSSTGAITNPNSKLCLAWTSPASSTGTQLKLATCNTKAMTDTWAVTTVDSTGTGSGGTGGTGSTGGSGTGTTATCSTGGSKLATLQDGFTGTGLNSSNWYVEPIAGQGNTLSGSAKVSGGVLTLSQNTGYTSVNSQKSYDITSSCGFMKLIPDPNSTADQADDGWGIWNSTPVNGSPSFSSGYEIGVQSGKLYVMAMVNDNVAPFSFSATYNPSTMVYARIRESGGKLYFGYSADGTTWTEPAGWSLTWSSSILNVKSCSVQIYAGNLGSKNVGSAGFADFNVAN